MRCFEEHQVVTLEANGTIHKPLYCSVHATENLKYFCYSCETPVCNECLISDHKATDHHYEIISEAEKDMRMDVEKLLKNTRGKIEYCDAENAKLESSLEELQQQNDAACNEISKAYDTIIEVVQKRKEQAMSELDNLHTEREIKIMEQIHQIEKAVEQMEYCAMFTRKLLDNGNGHEILSMKKMISQQLIKLIDTIPKVEINYSIEFISNVKKFEELAPELFGKFRTESTVSPKESTPPPTLPGMMPPLLNSTIKTGTNCLNGSSITTGSISVTASSPISLPTSMQSSFDGGDISNGISSFGGKTFSSSLMPNTNLMSESPTPIIPPAQLNVVPPAVSSMVEYNLHRLASMVENTSPDLTDSIMPSVVGNNSVGNSFLIDEMLNGGDTQMLNNLQALAKIGDMTNGNSISSLGMMDSFMTSTSPILQTPSALGGINDDIKLNCFSQFRSHDNSITNGATNGLGRAKALSMQIRVKFGALGQSRGQFNSPHGFCLGLDEEIIVADTNNHRIEVIMLNINIEL
jgi:hypothetical protein